MVSRWLQGAIGGLGALCLAITLTPAHANRTAKHVFHRHNSAFFGVSGIGSFTPAAADPRLAAAFARSGLGYSGFRFTPSGAGSVHVGHGITVAVRARAVAAPLASSAHATASPSQFAPVAYNLGVAVGWKKFALSGDYHKTDLGLIEGGREGADLGVSYNTRRWSSRVSVLTDRTTSSRPAALGVNENVSVDVGGAYRLTRNVDLTAGVRYKRERDRFDQFSDTKRDGQAVYVGTQFKF